MGLFLMSACWLLTSQILLFAVPQVLNLGTYESEDDAARAWNAAAVYFRGEGTWINPVQPPLPANYQPGVLQGPAAAVAAAAAIKQAQEAAASAQD